MIIYVCIDDAPPFAMEHKGFIAELKPGMRFNHGSERFPKIAEILEVVCVGGVAQVQATPVG